MNTGEPAADQDLPASPTRRGAAERRGDNDIVVSCHDPLRRFVVPGAKPGDTHDLEVQAPPYRRGTVTTVAIPDGVPEGATFKSGPRLASLT